MEVSVFRNRAAKLLISNPDSKDCYHQLCDMVASDIRYTVLITEDKEEGWIHVVVVYEDYHHFLGTAKILEYTNRTVPPIFSVEPTLREAFAQQYPICLN